MPISITFIALCCCSLGVVFASVHPGKAQVPDVGPGVCVQDFGTCNDPSPRYSSGSSFDTSYSGPSARQRAAIQHQQTMNNMLLNTVQGLMGNFMEGFERGMEHNWQRQQQRQQEILRHAQEEMARERQRALAGQRAMAKKRLQLQEAKERITGAVRSMSSSGTPVRPMLRVGESISAFGTKSLKPRDTGDLVGMDATAKVVCGQGLLYAAGGAAVNGSQEGLVASLKEARISQPPSQSSGFGRTT